MQSFRVRREGSSSKIKPREVSREPSGEMRTSLSTPKSSGYGVTRQKSDMEKRRSTKQTTSQIHVDSPQISRQKSDSGRVNLKTPDYSNVRGSGYGVSATKARKELSSGSLKGEEHRRSTTRLSVESKDSKIRREKSGDLLGTTPTSSLRKSISREEVRTHGAATQGGKPRTSSGSKKASTSTEEDGAASSASTPKSTTSATSKGKLESRRSVEASKSTKTTRKSTTPTSKQSTKK